MITQWKDRLETFIRKTVSVSQSFCKFDKCFAKLSTKFYITFYKNVSNIPNVGQMWGQIASMFAKMLASPEFEKFDKFDKLQNVDSQISNVGKMLPKCGQIVELSANPKSTKSIKSVNP